MEAAKYKFVTIRRKPKVLSDDDVEVVEKPVECSTMKCCICHDNINIHIAFGCNRHMACATCIIEYIASLYRRVYDDIDRCVEDVGRTKLICPMCRSPCETDSKTLTLKCTLSSYKLHVLPDMVYDTFSTKTVKCPHAPCVRQGPLREIANHVYCGCEHAQCTCSFGGKKVSVNGLSTHIFNDCDLKSCPFCYFKCYDQSAFDLHTVKHNRYVLLRNTLARLTEHLEMFEESIDFEVDDHPKEVDEMMMHANQMCGILDVFYPVRL